MDLTRKYLNALGNANMFESSGHRTRFKELLDCYSGFPFFTKGLCKCMYVAAFDEEHFCSIVEILSSMNLGNATSLTEMKVQGDIIARAQVNPEHYMYLLANAFLDDRSFELTDSMHLTPEQRHIIQKALEASKIIDEV